LPAARRQLTVLDANLEDTNMEPRREGLIWQALGLLVVIAAAMEIRSVTQQLTWLSTQKSYGAMDVVWPYALGVYAGFLLLAGATAMISGHVLRVMGGGRHRGWTWKLAGLFCCLASMAMIVAKMTHVAMSRGVRGGEAYDFFNMLTNGDFVIAMSGGYLFLLGIMLLMADQLGARLRRLKSVQ
jgi:hypothetical protein